MLSRALCWRRWVVQKFLEEWGKLVGWISHPRKAAEGVAVAWHGTISAAGLQHNETPLQWGPFLWSPAQPGRLRDRSCRQGRCSALPLVFKTEASLGSVRTRLFQEQLPPACLRCHLSLSCAKHLSGCLGTQSRQRCPSCNSSEGKPPR